ncbi:phenoloxidase-activating enzyme-like [Ostrinia nubilalis]|uniref:phenoloxidase-activating enzyme-like n=1 Tax=Ostrinia nubilalis TaxID=29057 RepID=UPI00308220C2
MKLLIFASALFVAASYVNGQSCTTTNGDSGNCVTIHKCPSLLQILNKPNRSPADVDLLRKSACGFEGNTPKVCCPCYTPYGELGKCISIYTCPHLAKLLVPPVTTESMSLVEASRCQGPDDYSVCCGPPPDSISEGSCKSRLSALPPDPRSGCCGVGAGTHDKIIGGTETRVDEYPWMSVIEYLKTDNKIALLCIGSLISSRYVLTAAHCLTGTVLKIGTPKNIRLGDYDLSHDGPDCVTVDGFALDCTDDIVVLPIEKTISHAEYNPITKHNDIGLVRTKQAAPYTDFIQPICLPVVDVTAKPLPNFKLWVAGWGDFNNTHTKSMVKLHVRLPFVSQEECQPAYSVARRKIDLWSGQICAGGEARKDSCKGSSGGPLMLKNERIYEIIGLVSFGPAPCGMDDVPGVYSKVYAYLDWIKGNIEQSCTTAKGDIGNCVTFKKCPSLLQIINKSNRSPAEVDLLKKSACGFEGRTPKVCCPCHTPYGEPGRCVGIYSCPHLAEMMTAPVTSYNKLFIQASKCQGPDAYSVCCGSPPESIQKNGCDSRLSAFPPDPRTECCGLDGGADNKITGGSATNVDQYPWLTLIEYARSDNSIALLCGGALISSRYVLTAAHCITGSILKNGTPKNVRLGEYDSSHTGPDCILVEGGGEDCTEGIVVLPIEKSIPHPEYNPITKRNDIGLIRTQRAAPYTDFIRPICLPVVDITVTPPPNFKLWAAGWGAINSTVKKSSIKLHVDLPFVSQRECQPSYVKPGLKADLWNGQLCAGGEAGKDSCRGDSGGPLMFENEKLYDMLGVVSFGPSPCGKEDAPGVYTKVYAYVDWIRENIYP